MTEKRFEKKLEKIKKRGERQKQEKALIDAYAQYYPDKKKKKVSNIMLVIIVFAIVGYVIADFVLQYRVGVEISPTITTCWFSFWTVEIVALAGIKVSKVKHEVQNIECYSDDSELQDEEILDVDE